MHITLHETPGYALLQRRCTILIWPHSCQKVINNNWGMHKLKTHHHASYMYILKIEILTSRLQQLMMNVNNSRQQHLPDQVPKGEYHAWLYQKSSMKKAHPFAHYCWILHWLLGPQIPTSVVEPTMRQSLWKLAQTPPLSDHMTMSNFQ